MLLFALVEISVLIPNMTYHLALISRTAEFHLSYPIFTPYYQVKAAQKGIPTGIVYKQNEERLTAVGTKVAS